VLGLVVCAALTLAVLAAPAHAQEETTTTTEATTTTTEPTTTTTAPPEAAADDLSQEGNQALLAVLLCLSLGLLSGVALAGGR
jgi:uncharacterized protein HemX